MILSGTTKRPVAEMALDEIFEDPLRLDIDSTGCGNNHKRKRSSSPRKLILHSNKQFQIFIG